MCEKLNYDISVRLHNRKSSYVITDGRAFLAAGEERFQMGQGDMSDDVVRQANKELPNSIELVDYSKPKIIDGIFKHREIKSGPMTGMYVSQLVTLDGRPLIVLHVGSVPQPWPERVTRDASKLDYFDMLLLNEKPGVYHYNDGYSRLVCEGEVYDCGFSDSAVLENGEMGELSRTTGKKGSLGGVLMVKLIGSNYALVLMSIDGSLSFIRHGNIEKELDALPEKSTS